MTGLLKMEILQHEAEQRQLDMCQAQMEADIIAGGIQESITTNIGDPLVDILQEISAKL
jgi:hypothetical protein